MAQKFNLGSGRGDGRPNRYPKGVREKAVSGDHQVIDAPTFRRIIRRFYALLQTNEQLLNDLNVFPVPDGDTGTNTVLTLQAGMDVLDKGRSDLASVVTGLAKELGLGARGNSGVILAEYLHGFAELSDVWMTPQQWHEALQAAAALSGEAVSVPREGTMLTIAQVAASIKPSGEFAEYAIEIATCVRAAVKETTEQLAELAAAGVVDSGALALSYFHEAVANEMSGREMPEIELAQRTCDVTAIEYRGPSHEVMFLFDGDAESLREELTVIGESVTVTGRQNPFNVHVHVDQPGDALSEAMRHGRAYRISITRLVGNDEVADANLSGVSVVLAGEGQGLRKVVTDAGAHFVAKPPMSSLATSDFVRAIRDANAAHVIVLPSDVDCHASVALAAHEVRAEGIVVHMIGTASLPASLAALAVFDESAELAQTLDSMTTAARATRDGAVMVAARDSMTAIGMCHEGDVIGLIERAPHEISREASIHDMAVHVVDAMLDHGGELVTVIVGQDGDLAISEQLAADHPGIEFSIIEGDQSAHPYVIGVE